MDLRSTSKLLKETFSEWSEDKVPRLGAALAYYTVFSIAPLLVITITIVGLFFGDAQNQVIDEVRSVVGDRGAKLLVTMVKATQKPAESVLATLLAAATLFFGAAGVFIQLKSALNTVWDVEKKHSGGIVGFLKEYLLSFGMVLGIGFLLLVSLLLSAGLSVIGNQIKGHFPGANALMNLLGFIASFGVITLLFAVLFKYLPDVKVAWRDVFVGAVVTAFLFVVGKFLLGAYLANAATVSAYGAAGSLVLVLLWIYYSAQIFFFGAEFTQVYSHHHGSRSMRVDPKKLTYKQQLVRESELQRQELQKALKAIQSPKNEANQKHHRRF